MPKVHPTESTSAELAKSWLAVTTKSAKAELKSDLLSSQASNEVESGKPFLAPPLDSGKTHIEHYGAWLEARAKSLRSYDDLNKSERALYDVVMELVKTEPYLAEERTWVARPQTFFAEKVSLSTKQVRRISHQNPFRWVLKKVSGKKMSLIRVGHPSDLTHEDCARIMVKDWEKLVGKAVKQKEFGCLVGISKESPEALAPDIFCTAVDNWTCFMAGVKLAISMASVEGDEFESDPSKFSEKYYQYPSITVIRRFWTVAKEQYSFKLQDWLTSPKPCPDLCIKINKVMNKYNNISSI
jgi:hypothetical protein